MVLERADRVGGTWRDNTYPGCRCDVPSHLYSFSFAPHPGWTETYVPQPEVQRYLRDVAHRFGVTDRTRFGHDVLDASWDVMVEAQVRYVVDALRAMGAAGAATVEVRGTAMTAWRDEIARRTAPTVWSSGGCASWYLDAEGRNTTLWPDHTFRFVRRTRRFDPGAYVLRPARSVDPRPHETAAAVAP